MSIMIIAVNMLALMYVFVELKNTWIDWTVY